MHNGGSSLEPEAFDSATVILNGSALFGQKRFCSIRPNAVVIACPLSSKHCLNYLDIPFFFFTMISPMDLQVRFSSYHLLVGHSMSKNKTKNICSRSEKHWKASSCWMNFSLRWMQFLHYWNKVSDYQNVFFKNLPPCTVTSRRDIPTHATQIAHEYAMSSLSTASF